MKKPRGQSVDDAQIRIQDMLDLLPRGCLGEFDFISGLLYVHCKNAEYKALVAKRSKAQGRWNAELSQRERLIVETSMHEYFHYLQVLSCGYLFETVAALSDALTGTLNRFKQDGSDDARRRAAVNPGLVNRGVALAPLEQPAVDRHGQDEGNGEGGRLRANRQEYPAVPPAPRRRLIAVADRYHRGRSLLLPSTQPRTGLGSRWNAQGRRAAGPAGGICAGL